MIRIIIKKRFIIPIILFVLLLVSIYVFYIFPNSIQSSQSITMYMTIEKKDYTLKNGEEMWIVGSNAYDDSKDKKRYKVMISDPRIFNLLEKGKIYFVDLEGVKKHNQSKYTYNFGTLALLKGSRMR